MLVDANRTPYDELPLFSLDGSNHTFLVVVEDGYYKIVDIDYREIYDWVDVANDEYDFHFYRKDDDENYCGVWVDV